MFTQISFHIPPLFRQLVCDAKEYVFLGMDALSVDLITVNKNSIVSHLTESHARHIMRYAI